MVDFGQGPVQATRFTWGDVFTAYYSTGIPDIEVYTVLPAAMQKRLGLLKTLRPLFRFAPLRALLQRGVQPGPSAEARAKTVTHVWGEVADAQGRTAVSRLHGTGGGPRLDHARARGGGEAGARREFTPGFQTPGKAFGPDFVLECEGVRREDVA